MSNHYLNQWCINLPQWVNSVAPGRSGSNFKSVISHILWIKLISTSCWIYLCECHNTFIDKSKLVQVMAWCHQAPSPCLSWCLPKSISLHAVTNPNEFIFTILLAPLYFNIILIQWMKSIPKMSFLSVKYFWLVHNIINEITELSEKKSLRKYYITSCWI